MRIVSNDRLIRRNTQIGKYATLGGTGLLVLALVLNILAITRPEDTRVLAGVLAAFFIGFTLTNVGTVYNNRWGRRPDRALGEGLKGLDERYVLYNYRLGASHVLVGPAGATVMVAKFQTGPVAFDGKKWLNPGARRTFLGLFNPNPLGNPVLEAAGEVEALIRFLKKKAPDVDLAPQALIVFVHPRAEVSAKDSPVPVLHVKQLKDFVRKQSKLPAAGPGLQAKLAEAVKA